MTCVDTVINVRITCAHAVNKCENKLCRYSKKYENISCRYSKWFWE